MKRLELVYSVWRSTDTRRRLVRYHLRRIYFRNLTKDVCFVALSAACPTEPTYLTNRAASYMAEKRFQPAISDCQTAATLQSASPSPKTLLRLARCHLALGSPEPALSSLRQVLEIEPKNASAIQLRTKAAELEAHLRNFHKTRAAKDWATARIALDRCFRAIEGGDADAPSEWLSWRLQLEIARGQWDSASIAAR